MQTTVRLLGICSIILILAIVYLILSPDKPEEVIAEKGPDTEELLPDSTKMDSVTYVSYLRIEEGAKIFKEAGCISCHEICSKKVGPALKGITQRREREWIYKAVTNFSKLKNSGDQTANELFNEFKVEMPIHNFLKKEEIDKILYFIDSSSCGDEKITASIDPESCAPETLAVYEAALSRNKARLPNLFFSVRVNETMNEVLLDLSRLPPDHYNLTLTDASGKSVLTDHFFSKEKTEHRLAIESLSKGVYFLRLQSPTGQGTKKFLKR